MVKKKILTEKIKIIDKITKNRYNKIPRCNSGNVNPFFFKKIVEMKIKLYKYKYFFSYKQKTPENNSREWEKSKI